MWVRIKRFLTLEKRVADLEETVQRVLPDYEVIAQTEQISTADINSLRKKADESYQKKYVTEPVPQSALCDTDAEHTKS